MVAGTNKWEPNHEAWHNGNIDKWALKNLPYSIGYYKKEDLPEHFALAEGFIVAMRTTKASSLARIRTVSFVFLVQGTRMADLKRWVALSWRIAIRRTATAVIPGGQLIACRSAGRLFLSG